MEEEEAPHLSPLLDEDLVQYYQFLADKGEQPVWRTEPGRPVEPCKVSQPCLSDKINYIRPFKSLQTTKPHVDLWFVAFDFRMQGYFWTGACTKELSLLP